MRWLVEETGGNLNMVEAERMEVGPKGSLVFYDYHPNQPKRVYSPNTYRTAYREDC